jgi:MFS family permease
VPLGVTAALFALQAAGIAILGPTIIATVSLVVPLRVLNTALGLTEMSFYLGAGSGTALVMAVLAAREGTERAINPLHTGAAPAYSDAFLVAVLPLLVAQAFALALGGSHPDRCATPSSGGDKRQMPGAMHRDEPPGSCIQFESRNGQAQARAAALGREDPTVPARH